MTIKVMLKNGTETYVEAEKVEEVADARGLSVVALKMLNAKGEQVGMFLIAEIAGWQRYEE